MAWYDNGIVGTKAYPTSAGLGQPALYYGYSFYNVNSPIIIDTFALNGNAGGGAHYKLLLNHFSLGTEIWLDVTTTVTTNSSFSTMVPKATYITNTLTLQLKKADGTFTNIGSNTLYYLTDTWDSNLDGLTFSINGYEYASRNGNLEHNPAAAFPFGGLSAGLNNSVLCVKNGAYLEFYLAGYKTDAGPYGGDHVYVNFPCPVMLLGRIPESILNDPEYFNPQMDAYTPDEEGGVGFGEGGNIPDLPVSPSYPGTDMTFPNLPTGASAFGFSRLTLYKPTSSNLADALDILYSDSDESTLETIIESCKKWWYKPEQYCISLMLSPVDATTSSSKDIKFGKYNSGVSAPYVTSQWHITDCGTINVPLKYGSFLDFEPHAKLKIYLPYVGFRSLNANEIIGGSVAIKYYTDILTGVTVCMMLVTRTGSNNTILYTFDCNVNMQVPLTSENYNTVVSRLLSAGAMAGAAAAGLGLGAISAKAAGALALGAAHSMNQGGTGDLTQSGNLSPNSGVLCYPKPYICVQMPIPTTPSNYNLEKGRPSNIFMSIGRCSGFTVISNLHVDIPGITDTEVNMIRQAFRQGVYC